jgi:hypothetical protein
MEKHLTEEAHLIVKNIFDKFHIPKVTFNRPMVTSNLFNLILITFFFNTIR